MDIQSLKRFLEVPLSSPEERRRAYLLNVLIVGIAVLALFYILATVAGQVAGMFSMERAMSNYIPTSLFIVGSVVLYVINRYWSVLIAASLFILLLITVIYTSVSPQEVVLGRNTVIMAVPVVIASMVLRPNASFITALVISLLFTYVSIANSFEYNINAIITFFAIALGSWLSSRNLEEAIEKLRVTNQDLDKRVNSRTRELFDVLAREHAETSRHQTILESIADGVIVFDEDRVAVLANESISRLLNQPKGQIVNQDIETLMVDYVDATSRQLVLKLMESDDPHHPSLKLDWGDKTLSVSFATIKDDRLNPIGGTVAVFRNFTREAEVDRMKSDFVSIASHELRTPLTSINGYLELLLMGAGGAVSEKQHRMIEIARSNTHRLSELVNDLLDLSKIESGKIALKRVDVDLGGLIRQAAADVQKQFDERKLTLTLDVPSLPTVYGDEHRIIQILINLLSNAYKYTPRGGAVVQARLHNEFVQVDVSDTGLGMSEKDLQKLFTRFFRSESKEVRKQSGTGLGMSITRSLVELHGGQIWVESELDRGTTFSFTLPISKQVEQQEEKPAPTVQVTHDDIVTIMVVDDEPETAKLFQYHLEQAGYHVTAVTQSRRVLDMAQAIKPDLITLDLLMEIGGLTLLEELKNNVETADIPVVIVSMLSKPEEGLLLGAADYISKPVDVPRLLASINQLIEQKEDDTALKILAVDDEEDLVNWFSLVLGPRGYEVTKAQNGIEAVDLALANPPDLILMDLMMPEMDGRTAIQRLREHETTRHIPVIVVSAKLPDSEERTEMLGEGVRQFMKKPVEIDELINQVQEHINGHIYAK